MDTKEDCTIQIKIQEDPGEFHKQQCSPHEVMSQFISILVPTAEADVRKCYVKKVFL